MNEVDKILEKLEKHGFGYHGFSQRGFLQFQEKILKVKDSEITQKLFEKYIDFLIFANGDYELCQRGTFINNDKHYIASLTKIINCLVPSNSIIINLMEASFYKIVNFIIDKYPNIIYTIFDNYYRYDENENDEFVKLTIRILEYVISAKRVGDFHKLLKYDIDISHIDISTYLLQAYDNLIESGYEIKQEDVYQIIYNDAYEVFCKLDNKLKFTEQVFIEALNTGKLRIIKYLIDNKQKIPENCVEYIGKNFQQVLQLLIENMYVITYDDVIRTIEMRKNLDDFNITHINIDENIQKLCIKYNFFPSYVKIESPEMKRLLLEELCFCKNNLKKIKEIIKSGIQPTQKCIQNACSISGNMTLIKFLESKKCYIDTICMIKGIEVNQKIQMQYIRDNYKKQEKHDLIKIIEIYQKDRKKFMDTIEKI